MWWPVSSAEVELAAQDVRAAARVDDPAGRDARLLVLLAQLDGVGVGADLDVLHAPAAERLGAVLQAAPEELVLEAPAIDLVRVGREVRGRAELDPLRDVAVVAGGQEEPEAVLAELRLLEVIPHADHLAVVVRAHLDARLADLEGSLRSRLRPLVRHQHASLGPGQLELDRHRQPGEAAAEDGDVVVPVRNVQRLQLQHRRRTVLH